MDSLLIGEQKLKSSEKVFYIVVVLFFFFCVFGTKKFYIPHAISNVFKRQIGFLRL